MRLHSLKLLIAAAIALRTVTSSKEYDFEMAQVDRPTAGHVDDRAAVHDDRLPQANNAMDSEERAPLPSSSVFSFEAQSKDMTPLFLENALAQFLENARALIRPNLVVDRPVSSYSEVTKAHVNLHDETMKQFGKGRDGLRVMTAQSSNLSKETTIELRETMVAAVTKYLEANKVVGTFEQVRASPMMFHPDAVKLMMNAVTKWNAEHPERRTFLLDAFVVMFDDVANLAPALAIAKQHSATFVEATRWQTALLKIFVDKKLDPGDVFDILELRKRSLTHENLDTFDEYLGLHHQYLNKGPKNKDRVDLMAYLRKEFGVRELIRKVADGREHSLFPDKMPARLMKSLSLEGDTKSIIDAAHVFSGAGIDESTVAGVVSNSQGSVSENVLALSVAQLAGFGKRDHTIAHRQEQHMEDLVESGKSTDEVYDWLKLSNQVSKGEFLPVARDAFAAYVKAFNKRHPHSPLNADVYLTQKLGAAGALKEPASKRHRTG